MRSDLFGAGHRPTNARIEALDADACLVAVPPGPWCVCGAYADQVLCLEARPEFGPGRRAHIPHCDACIIEPMRNLGLA